MKPSIKNALILFACAGPLAAVGAFLAQYLSSADISSSIMLALIALVLSGGVLALAGLWFSRRARSQRGWTALQFFLMPLLGIALAVPTAAIAGNLVTGEWQALQPAPETATGFIISEHASIYTNNLYLQAVSGSTYVYECTNAIKCTWTLKEYAPAENADALPCEVVPEIDNTPALPGAVTASLDSAVCHVDGVEYTRFILLEDGRIFAWSEIQSFNDFLLLTYGLGFFGLLAGLAVSIAALKLRK
jgi:hypothetical protein